MTSFTHPCSTFRNLICSFKPNKPHNNNWHPNKPLRIPKTSPPITDLVIDFGKYKGKMLGTLPSTYLKWVSKNLRAGDLEQWAKLADQVLEDPVYKDRLEWEFADSVLNGNNNSVSSSLSRNDGDDSAVSSLVEISERFGWDNEDGVGWSKVNFELLGTSKSAKIPRRSSSAPSTLGVKEEREFSSVDQERKNMKADGFEALSESEQRRRERRDRVKLKKQEEMRKEKIRILMNSKDTPTNGIERSERGSDDDQDSMLKSNNTQRSPFPGRNSLLKEVLNRRRFL